MTTPAQMEAMSKRELLDLFQAKARCEHTQGKAAAVWLWLQAYLNTQDRRKLLSAWGHATMQEGPAELDTVCKEIRASW